MTKKHKTLKKLGLSAQRAIQLVMVVFGATAFGFGLGTIGFLFVYRALIFLTVIAKPQPRSYELLPFLLDFLFGLLFAIVGFITSIRWILNEEIKEYDLMDWVVMILGMSIGLAFYFVFLSNPTVDGTIVNLMWLCFLLPLCARLGRVLFNIYFEKRVARR